MRVFGILGDPKGLSQGKAFCSGEKMWFCANTKLKSEIPVGNSHPFMRLCHRVSGVRGGRRPARRLNGAMGWAPSPGLAAAVQAAAQSDCN